MQNDENNGSRERTLITGRSSPRHRNRRLITHLEDMKNVITTMCRTLGAIARRYRHGFSTMAR